MDLEYSSWLGGRPETWSWELGGGVCVCVSVSPGGLGKAREEEDSVSRAMRATGMLIDPID